MTRTGMAICAALTAALGSGCGTIANFASGDPEVYGGVQKFMDSGPTLRVGNGISASGPGGAVGAALLLAEFPLTFLTDSLTIPLVLLLRPTPPDDDNSGAGGNRKVAAPPAAETGAQPSTEGPPAGASSPESSPPLPPSGLDSLRM